MWIDSKLSTLFNTTGSPFKLSEFCSIIYFGFHRMAYLLDIFKDAFGGMNQQYAQLLYTLLRRARQLSEENEQKKKKKKDFLLLNIKNIKILAIL